MARTIDGVWIGDGPCTVVPQGASDTDIGLTVSTALSQTRLGVPHPSQTEWKEVGRPTLEAAGVKNWRAFAKGARSLSISSDASGTITVIPSRSVGSNGAFLDIPGASSILGAPSTAEALGAAVRRQLEVSE